MMKFNCFEEYKRFRSLSKTIMPLFLTVKIARQITKKHCFLMFIVIDMVSERSSDKGLDIVRPQSVEMFVLCCINVFCHASPRKCQNLLRLFLLCVNGPWAWVSTVGVCFFLTTSAFAFATSWPGPQAETAWSDSMRIWSWPLDKGWSKFISMVITDDDVNCVYGCG